MPPADAWLGSGDEILIAQNRVERDRATRRSHVGNATVNAAGDVREQLIHAKADQLPYRAHRVDEVLELLVKPFPLAIAVRLERAGNEDVAEARLGLGGLFARDGKDRPALVMKAFLSIVDRAFVPDHGAHRIGELALGIFRAGMSDEIDLVCEALIEPDERPVRQIAMCVELLCTSRVQIRAQALESGQTCTVFHDDGLVIFGKGVIEQIRESLLGFTLAT